MSKEKVESAPTWSWLVLIAVSIVIFLLLIKKPPSISTKKIDFPLNVAAKKRIVATLYPDRYITILLPPHHWGHFIADKNFRVRLTNGKEFDFLENEKWPYLGDEIPDNKLELKSLTGEKIKIEIFLRPKT